MLASPDLSLVYILVLFGMAFFIVKNLIIGPIVRVLDERTVEISGAEEAHALALETARTRVAEVDGRLSAERRAAVALRAAIRAEGQAARQKALDAARAESDQLVSAERAALAQQIPPLREGLRREAEALAGEVSARVLGPGA